MVYLALLAVASAVLGFIPTNELSIRAGKNVLAEWTVLLIIGALVRSVWLRLFFWWCVLVYICTYNKVSFMAMSTFTLYVVAFEAIAQRFNLKDIGKLILGLRLIVLVQLSLMGLQYIGKDPIFLDVGDPQKPILTGFLDNTTIAAAFLATMLPLFFAKFWVCIVPVILIALFLTESFGGVLTALIIISIYCLIKFKWKGVAGLLLMLGLLSVYSLKYESLGLKISNEKANRIIVWKRVIHMSTIKPHLIVKGWGMGQYKVAYPLTAQKYFPDTVSSSGGKDRRGWRYAHNEFVQIFFEQGIVGLILILGFICTFFKDFFNVYKTDERTAFFLCFVTFLLTACYLFPLRVAGLSMPGLIIVSVLEVFRRGNQRTYR